MTINNEYDLIDEPNEYNGESSTAATVAKMTIDNSFDERNENYDYSSTNENLPEDSDSSESENENLSDNSYFFDDSDFFDDNDAVDILQEGLYSDDDEQLSDFDNISLVEGNK